MEAALSTQQSAWATWLEALLDVRLLQTRDNAAARAICVARMAHVLGAQHAPLLLELEQLCLGTRDTLLEHLASQTSADTANNAVAAGSSAGDAIVGDATEWIKWWKRARIASVSDIDAKRPSLNDAFTSDAASSPPPPLPGHELWRHYPPQPVPLSRTAPPPRPPSEPQPATFDLSLCEDTDGISVIGEARQTVERLDNNRKCCAPLTAVLEPSSGIYEFTFTILEDPSCGSGVGVIAAEGRSTNLPSAWPNTGQTGVWWLRRNAGETYSETTEHGSTSKVPVCKEVRMMVDTDAGTIQFNIDGKDSKYMCKGITQPVRPAVFFYNSATVRVSCVGLEPLDPGQASTKMTRQATGPSFTVHSVFSSSLKGPSAKVSDGGRTFSATEDCLALCEKRIQEDTGVHIMEVTLAHRKDDSVSYIGMATEESQRDRPPGRHSGGIGLTSCGSLFRDGKQQKSGDQSCRLGDRDVVRLEYDSGPKRSLKWFRNGVLIHEETQVSPGMHFAVGRWTGSPELRLNPSPKVVSIKSSKTKEKKDLSRARPSVGDSVKIIASSDTSCEPHVGQKGVLVEDDRTGRPFNVKFDDGNIW